MGSPGLQLVQVKKNFQEGQLLHEVIRDATAHFLPGRTYALMGHSGSGKSTLMHIIAALDKPTAGTVFYNGQDLYRLSEQRVQLFLQKSVGLLFQQPYLLSELTVQENCMLPGLIAGKSMSECRHDSMRLLEAVGLEQKADSKPGALSGGQQQRIALARALINKPEFLIADEPTGNLDDQTGKQIVALMLSLQKIWGMGIVVSTHDQHLGQSMENCLYLEQGILHQR